MKSIRKLIIQLRAAGANTHFLWLPSTNDVDIDTLSTTLNC